MSSYPVRSPSPLSVVLLVLAAILVVHAIRAPAPAATRLAFGIFVGSGLVVSGILIILAPGTPEATSRTVRKDPERDPEPPAPGPSPADDVDFRRRIADLMREVHRTQMEVTLNRARLLALQPSPVPPGPDVSSLLIAIDAVEERGMPDEAARLRELVLEDRPR